MKKIEYQTRSETTGLNFWDTLKEAYDDATNNPTIWKLSYTGDDKKRHRWIISRDDQNNITNWSNEPCIIKGRDVTFPVVEELTDVNFRQKYIPNLDEQ